ncbi:MAG TPA: VWA domain-containing protein [Terriglobales bacterium]|nr:VWA domain-containing protein [Terriglobales bacterium]
MNIQTARSLRLTLSVLVGICSLQLVLAQQNTASQADAAGNLVLKRTVRRVVVDVVVTDSGGNPARGLSEKDFSVKEDGKPQQILSFDAHDWAASYAPLKLPHLPPNTYLDLPATPERGPLYVLLYDLVNTEMDDQATARKEMLDFIKTKPDGTRFAIFVLSDELRLVQGFTDDRKELLDALDPNSPKPHVPRIFLMGRNSGRGDVRMMVSVLNDIANFLDGLAGRKNLIWFSGGFPLTLFPRDDDGQTYREEIKDTLNTMARGQVAIYPVDVRGVVVTNYYAPAGATPGGGVYSDSRSGSVGSATGSGTSASSANANTAGPAASAAATAASSISAAGVTGFSELNSGYQTQDEIAYETGGHAFHSNNGLKESLAQVTEMGANYYTLSYSPTNENYDGALRSIHVDLARRGYHLAYRRSYYGDDPGSSHKHTTYRASNAPSSSEPSASQPGELLYANMQHGAPQAHEVFFSVHIHPVAPAATATPAQLNYFADQPAFEAKHHKGKQLAPFQVQPYVADFFVPTRQFRQHSPLGDGDALEFTTVAYDADGMILNSIVQMASDPASAAEQSTAQHTGYHILQNIDVPAKAASIRVGVRDKATDHIGTLEVALPLTPEPPTQAAAAPASNLQR